MQTQRIPRGPKSTAHRTLGRAVRELRARFGLSQEGLAFQAGLHRNYVGGSSAARSTRRFTTLMRLARGFEITLSELIDLYEERAGHVLPPALVGAPHRLGRR
jgi:transcriptional regulator with XRE-family HTH domain